MPRTSRRIVRPEPFWRDLIDRWRASGRSITAFCAAHAVGEASFYAWRRRLGGRRSMTKPAPTFAAVRVVPDPTAEVVLPSGLIVRVPVSTDPAAFARLVTALGGGAC